MKLKLKSEISGYGTCTGVRHKCLELASDKFLKCSKLTRIENYVHFHISR